MKVLFHIESAVFKNDPLFLARWLGWVQKLAALSRPSLACSIVSSHAICALASSAFEQRFEIDSGLILEPVGFDRRAYMVDVCQGDASTNRYLRAALENVRDKLDPDIVISWTENTYLRSIFPDRPVMYMELGPLPRIGLALSVHLDPFGHQIGSALDRFSEPPPGLDRFSAVQELWSETWGAAARRLAAEKGVPEWLEGATRGSKATLAVLQPPDWLTYEGVGPHLDPESLLRSIASSQDPGRLVVPQWHPQSVPPGEIALQELAYHHPNLRIPPAELRVGLSEIFLPYVDGIETISSNVAALAAIVGKPIRSLGRSKFEAFASTARTPAVPRPDLAAFLLSRYCAPWSEWLTSEGAFARHLMDLVHRPESLFDVDPDVREALRRFDVTSQVDVF